MTPGCQAPSKAIDHRTSSFCIDRDERHWTKMKHSCQLNTTNAECSPRFGQSPCGSFGQLRFSPRAAVGSASDLGKLLPIQRNTDLAAQQRSSLQRWLPSRKRFRGSTPGRAYAASNAFRRDGVSPSLWQPVFRSQTLNGPFSAA